MGIVMGLNGCAMTDGLGTSRGLVMEADDDGASKKVGRGVR